MTKRSTLLAVVMALAVAIGTAGDADAAPHWARRITRLVGTRPMSVVVGEDGRAWYRHLARNPRPPASNEKLLLSMALLDRFGAARRFPVEARATGIEPDGSIVGNLYLRGSGDPEVAGRRLDALAARLATAGVTSIDGRVIGVTGPFRHDWWASGWKTYFPREYIALPTALTFRGNVAPSGRHIADPERHAAAYLSRALRNAGVTIARRAGAGGQATGLRTIASVSSQPLATIVRHMDRRSINFSAEVLGKALAHAGGEAGTIANGAAAICAFEAAHGVAATCHDSSGLSYGNRQTALGIVRMLWAAGRQPWAGALRKSLPDGGQGTLRHRLGGVRIRAKTGTLIDVSALSGWVWSDAADAWIEFSILSDRMNAYEAKDLEDAIVRVLAAHAHAPR